MNYRSLLFVSLSLLAGTAWAGDPPASPAEQKAPEARARPAVDEFARLDANHDGVLARAELAQHPKAAHMAMVDANQDGVLDRGEFDALLEM